METIMTQSNEICSVCRKSFSVNDVIHYEKDTICFNCKNEYFQKVREGVDESNKGTLVYASVSTRFVASLIDGIITIILNLIITFLLTGSIVVMGKTMNDSHAVGTTAILAIIIPQILGLLYSVVFIGWKGATPGKMLFKIKVVQPDGSPITFGRAFLRYIGYFISSIILGIGYIMAFFDNEKRALHDRIAGTRVIYQ
jgi:uncharacterized RDD family membrane protein YckC